MQNDYKKLGLKCGIEIHQRLDTKKLFCGCSSSQNQEAANEIKRKLRAVAGELGGYDPAALYEFLRARTFVYKLYPSETCLVECDEEPPHPLNKEALEIAIQICKLLNCRVPEEIYVMRKTVIDGSNTTGFQRTAVVGMNGSMETSFGKLRITSVCLEEEAARIEDRSNGKVTYRLNGLGIPLVEIATSADITTPEQAKEVAEKLGLILRSTKVQRGIGTIRQDVNVSIREGARVEIKGFQELGKIETLITNESARQASLIEIREELKRRGKKEIKTKDMTHLFMQTKCNFIRKIIAEKGVIAAVMLPNFAGLLRRQCGDRTFGKELSSYAEAYGYGIIHSDEDLDKYQLRWNFESMKKEFNAAERDLILIIAGKSPEKAASAVVERAEHCYTGVPEETRISDNSGSKYTRPLPGSERMYPETDVPPIRIDEKYLALVKAPKTLLEKGRELEKELPKEIINQLIKSKAYHLFEELRSFRVDPVLIANTLLSTAKDLKRKGFAVEKISKGDLKYIFGLVESKKIPKDSIAEALIMITQGKKNEIAVKFSGLSDDAIEAIIEDTIKNNPGKTEGALMGIVMGRIKGRASGEKISKILRKKLNNM